MFSLSNSALRLLLVVAVAAVGCAEPDRRGSAPSTDETAPNPTPSDAASAPADSSNGAVDPAVGKLLAEMSRGELERRSASRAEVSLARKKLDELDFEAARRALDRAIRVDPSNVEAREMQSRLLFALGEREGAIALVSDELADRERVRREQTNLELARLYEEANALMKAQRYDEASKLYELLLLRIDLAE